MIASKPLFLSLDESKILLGLCKAGKLFDVQKWIASGRSICVSDDSRNTPISMALELGFHSLVEVLISNESRQTEKNDALLQAVRLRRFDFVDLIVGHGAEIHSIDFADVLVEWNPLVIRFFLDHGTNVLDGMPFAQAFRERIRTAIGPFKRLQEERPEISGLLQEQADCALRYFCREGNQKWISLMLWLGANPRTRGPSMSLYGDDPESYSTAIEEVCSNGDQQAARKLGLSAEKDDLEFLLRSSAWSVSKEFMKYLLELGAQPNNMPNGGSSTLSRCLYHLRFEDFQSQRWHSFSSKWDLSKTFSCIEVLVEYGARWMPDDGREIADIRKALLRCYPEVTLSLLKLLLGNNCCSIDVAKKLIGTPEMKKRMQPHIKELAKLKLIDIAQDEFADCRKLLISPFLISKYPRDKLYDEVWSIPLKKLGKQYGVSDVFLAKVCRKLLVPLPGKGYWAKKEAGKPLKPRPQLPSL